MTYTKLNSEQSPWGHIDTEREIAPGIVSVSTPSHGGLWLSPERWQEFRSVLPFFEPYAAAQWLEEDCDCGVACLVWPEIFGAECVRGAVRMVRGWWGKENQQELLAWLNAEGKGLIALAERWEAENADKWETGSMGTGGNGWRVWLNRISDGAQQVRYFPDYPTQQLYTTAELEQVSRATKEVSIETFKLPSGQLAAASAGL